MWRLGQLLPAQILACALAWQEPFRQAEGEPIERQRVQRAVLFGRQFCAQVLQGDADSGLVQSLDQHGLQRRDL